MRNEAFLVGISQYADHTIDGIANDLELLATALQRRNYPRSAIHVFHDSHTTLVELYALLEHIQTAYRDTEHGSCYLHIGASGALSVDPIRGGVLPRDGTLSDFTTALPFAALNSYLPIRPGVQVTVTIDT